MRFWKEHLHALIIVFILAGMAVGSLLNYSELAYKYDQSAFGFYLFNTLDLLGKLFLYALKMVIIPVIITSIVFGLGGMSKGARVGRIALRTIGYYLLTTGIAVIIGLVLVIVAKPGAGAGIEKTVAGLLKSRPDAAVQKKVDRAQAQLRKEGLEGLSGAPLMFIKLKNLAVSLMPQNAFRAMSDGKFLPLIVFSILLGVTLLSIREKAPMLLQFFEQAQMLFFALLGGIMYTAPIGFFALVATLAWTVGLEGVGTIWVYGVAVVAGLAIHGFIVLPLILWIFARRSPLEFAGKMRHALVMAFSTASSSATLPTTMRCAEENAGIDNDYASFVLPLGSTVNMDGTAIYESIALVTLYTAYVAAAGIPDATLGLAQLVIIFITVTLAAVGAAGVPGAGIFMLIMMMGTIKVGNTVGIPVHLIGLILVLDRPLDMMRTCINVWGDSVGAAVVSYQEGKSSST